jgi:hypothetical protein
VRTRIGFENLSIRALIGISWITLFVKSNKVLARGSFYTTSFRIRRLRKDIAWVSIAQGNGIVHTQNCCVWTLVTLARLLELTAKRLIVGAFFNRALSPGTEKLCCAFHQIERLEIGTTLACTSSTIFTTCRLIRLSIFIWGSISILQSFLTVMFDTHPRCGFRSQYSDLRTLVGQASGDATCPRIRRVGIRNTSLALAQEAMWILPETLASWQSFAVIIRTRGTIIAATKLIIRFQIGDAHQITAEAVCVVKLQHL